MKFAAPLEVVIEHQIALFINKVIGILMKSYWGYPVAELHTILKQFRSLMEGPLTVHDTNLGVFPCNGVFTVELVAEIAVLNRSQLECPHVNKTFSQTSFTAAYHILADYAGTGKSMVFQYVLPMLAILLKEAEILYISLQKFKIPGQFVFLRILGGETKMVVKEFCSPGSQAYFARHHTTVAGIITILVHMSVAERQHLVFRAASAVDVDVQFAVVSIAVEPGVGVGACRAPAGAGAIKLRCCPGMGHHHGPLVILVHFRRLVLFHAIPGDDTLGQVGFHSVVQVGQ